MAETPDAPSQRQRLFFALWPDDEVRRRFAAIASKSLKRRGRRIPADNLHLTLAFLGPVTAEVRRCAEEVAGGVAAEPFTLEFTSLGFFPRPRVVWSGCEVTPQPLIALVDALRVGLEECGVQPEARPYRAHLTLARKASLPPDFGAPHAPVAWRVDSFHLVESKTSPEGAQYNILRSWGL